MSAAGTGHVPQPPEYLDPLNDIDGCYYYAVPKYFSHDHPNTRWLTRMTMQGRTDRVLRKMELKPRLFKEGYYQLADDPTLYWGKQTTEHPVFHPQAVLYFTTAAVAVYLGQDSFLESMLQYRDTYGAALHSVDSPQFATHVHDTKAGDVHAFTLATVMLRCCRFPCALPLLRHGWDPLQAVAMPARRRHERRALYFADWLDQALWLLADRPTYPLPALVLAMARDPLYWPRRRMPMAHLQATREPGGGGGGSGGLVDVEELPSGAPRLLGVKTLADMVKEFGRFQQAKQLHMDMQRQMRRAIALGANPERLLAQCQDFSGAFQGQRRTPPVPQSESGESSTSSPSPRACCGNNSAKQPTPQPQPQPTAQAEAAAPDAPYASEPVRILHYALERDRQAKTTRQCLEAMDIYVRRGFYLTCQPMAPGSARLRDARNAAVLLLNLAQRQMAELGGGGGGGNGSLSRRLACLRVVGLLLRLLTRLLLHSKQFADFMLRQEFPPYRHAADVDFDYAEGLALNYADLRLGVAQQFNAEAQSSRHLTLEDLQRLRGARGLRLRLRLGKPPPPPRPAGAATGDTELDGASEEEEEEKSGSCRKRKGWCCSHNTAFAAAAAVSATYANPPPPTRVTFVRVAAGRAARPRRSDAAAAAATADTAVAVPIDSVVTPDEASTSPTEATVEALDASTAQAATSSNSTDSTPLLTSEEEEEEEEAATPADGSSQRSTDCGRRQRRPRRLGGLGRWLAGLGRRAWRRAAKDGE